jgi:hypothetical protein
MVGALTGCLVAAISSPGGKLMAVLEAIRRRQPRGIRRTPVQSAARRPVWLVLWTAATAWLASPAEFGCTQTCATSQRPQRPSVGQPDPSAERPAPVAAGASEPVASSAMIARARDARFGFGDSFACVVRAHEYVLSGRLARRLCRGSESTAPVDCYSAADSESLLPASQLIALCQCATSIEPADCYSELEQNTLLPARRIVALCSPILSGTVDRKCRPLYWHPE